MFRAQRRADLGAPPAVVPGADNLAADRPRTWWGASFRQKGPARPISFCLRHFHRCASQARDKPRRVAYRQPFARGLATPLLCFQVPARASNGQIGRSRRHPAARTVAAAPPAAIQMRVKLPPSRRRLARCGGAKFYRAGTGEQSAGCSRQKASITLSAAAMARSRGPLMAPCRGRVRSTTHTHSLAPGARLIWYFMPRYSMAPPGVPPAHPARVRRAHG
jgi:hypothetical protein